MLFFIQTPETCSWVFNMKSRLHMEKLHLAICPSSWMDVGLNIGTHETSWNALPLSPFQVSFSVEIVVLALSMHHWRRERTGRQISMTLCMRSHQLCTAILKGWLPEFRRFRPAMGAELWLSMNKRVLDADRPLLILLRPIGHLVSCYVWVASAAPISRGERLRDGSWDASKPPSWIWIPKLEFCRQILVVREAWVQHCLAFLPALVHPLFALTVGRSFAMSWC